tara:strand:+ start:475 stop:603 length:129 start_codon:yes stop_codon:yes gene_type:complete
MVHNSGLPGGGDEGPEGGDDKKDKCLKLKLEPKNYKFIQSEI